MKNPTGTKQGKLGGIPCGGSSHVRYDHKRRPASLEIKCPSCNNRAIAQDNHAEEGYVSVGDLSPNWKDSSFAVKCLSCMYRAKNISYEELTEPFQQIVCRGEILWAWNLKHLEMIYLFLDNRNIKGHQYEFYSTYIHGDWKKFKDSYVKAIDTWLSQNQLSFK
jgi:ribosomal protein S27E